MCESKEGDPMIGFRTDLWQLKVAVISALHVLPSLTVAQQGPIDVHPDDAFLRYKGKASRGEVPVPPNLTADLADQFETKEYAVHKGRGICNPADQGEGIVDEDTHLTGYKIKLAPDETGAVPITLASPPSYLTTDVTLGVPETQCWRFTSCTGTLHCSGGANVDTLTAADSLTLGEPSCIQDGTNFCPDDPSSLCCSNSCEGVQVGSGKDNVVTIGVNPTDSGVGAMVLICNVDVLAGAPFQTDCSTEDISGATSNILSVTTGIGTTNTLNHCAGTGAPPDVTPTFSNTGENLDCNAWTTEDSVGTLVIPYPSEEPSPLVTGDIPTAFVIVDASPSGAFLEGSTGALD
jgi:hypothetical protein